MRDYRNYKTFAQDADAQHKARDLNYRLKGQGDGYLLGKFHNGEVGAIDEEVKRIGLELNALIQHMGITPDERNSKQLNSLFPTGHILTMATDDIPSGYLACDGSVLDRSLYTNIFGVIGETYGNGNGVQPKYYTIGNKQVNLAYADGVWQYDTDLRVEIDSVRGIYNNYRVSTGEHLMRDIAISLTESSDKYNFGNMLNTSSGVRADVLVGKAIEGGQLDLSGVLATRISPINDFTHTIFVGDARYNTLFNIPDFRGMFLRGHRTGTATATDPNYSEDFGVKQTDAFQGWHLNAGGNDMGVILSNRYDNGIDMKIFGSYRPGTGDLYNYVFIDDGVHGTPRVGFETRGVNYAVNYCIKY